MPIEFRCTQCQRLLRTADDTAGRQAKCPECGAILTIPTPSAPATPPPAGPAAPGEAVPPSPPGQPGAAGPTSPAAGPQGPFAPSIPPPGAPGDPENPYQSPTAYAVGPPPSATAAAAAIRPTQIDLGDVFSRTWTIFKEQWGMCLGLVVVAWLIEMGFQMVASMIPILGPIASMLFSVWINVGVALALLKIARGQEASIGDIFQGAPYFLQVLGATLLFLLITGGVFFVCFGVGFAALYAALGGGGGDALVVALILLGLLCTIPVTVISLIFSQYYFLILDGRTGILDSLTLSREIMVGNKLILLAIWVLMGLLMIAGFLACCVGAFVSGSFVRLMQAVIYLAITGQPTAAEIYGGAYYPDAAGSAASPFADTTAPPLDQTGTSGTGLDQ